MDKNVRILNMQGGGIIRCDAPILLLFSDHMLAYTEHVCSELMLLSLFAVLELAEGGELFDKIIEKTRFNEAEAKLHFYQIASAIQYLHHKVPIAEISAINEKRIIRCLTQLHRAVENGLYADMICRLDFAMVKADFTIAKTLKPLICRKKISSQKVKKCLS
jgi:serine/threonine protein kinase